MAKNTGHLKVKRFISNKGKNQYLLISGNEAAAIDVSDTVDDVGKILKKRSLVLKYVLVSHAHQSHVTALSQMQERFGAAFCLQNRTGFYRTMIF